jgi:lysylphosphatidylglycerol synthetase-like protein (DUF2156 family)
MTPSVFHSLDEALWGLLLIALTMVVHGVGVSLTLRAGEHMRRRWQRDIGLGRLVLATWMLVVVHMVEVVCVWAVFLNWKDAFHSIRDCVYYALMQYTTVGSDLELPDRLRLIGGMIAMSGLLTFAWTTAVLLALAQEFQRRVAGEHADGER